MSKKRMDSDVKSEGPWYENYDYGGSEEASSKGPGRGLYNGPMDRYRSVKDFINKKRKKRKQMKKAFTMDQLEKAASKFCRLAGEEIDMSFTDAIREKYTPIVFKDAEKVLQENAVSSIEIRISYQVNKAVFEVRSTGQDAGAVDSSLANLLNKKYGMALTATINKALGGKQSTFNFGLTTVETA